MTENSYKRTKSDSSSTHANCISLIDNTIWASKKSLALHFAV
jgi:hypothetical protein